MCVKDVIVQNQVGLHARPAIWQEREVPEVLLSGHHKNIEKYKHEQSLLNTLKKRPEMLESANLSQQDVEFIKNNQ